MCTPVGQIKTMMKLIEMIVKFINCVNELLQTLGASWHMVSIRVTALISRRLILIASSYW